MSKRCISNYFFTREKRAKVKAKAKAMLYNLMNQL